MKLFFTLMFLAAFSASGQTIPKVHVNHVALVLDSADLKAIKNSDFIKNEFAAISTRTTKADNGGSWTGTYLYGIDSYLELTVTSAWPSGLSLSVDRVGEILKVDSSLKKSFKTELRSRERMLDGKLIPWFSALAISDSAFFSTSHLYFWVMEYKPEYFDYKHWANNGKLLTATAYLKEFDKDRQNKILKRFTGATFKLTKQENQYLTSFLLNCGCRRTGANSFVSPDNFSFRLMPRDKNTRYSLASLEFEANRGDIESHVISEHIKIILNRGKGRIDFN